METVAARLGDRVCCPIDLTMDAEDEESERMDDRELPVADGAPDDDEDVE